MSRWLKRFKQEREVAHAPERADQLPAPLHKSHLSQSQFDLVKLGHHGLPRNPCTLAYDPLRKLLCVGTALGQVKIIGQTGVEVLVESSAASAITFAFLHSQAGLLITITADSVIEKWSLRDMEIDGPACEPQGRRKFNTKITAAHHRGSDSVYIYIGTSGGVVHVLDIDELAFVPTVITTQDVVPGGERGFKNKADIVGLETHPAKPTRLLIGYASGLVVMWDVKDEEVHRRFQYTFAKNLRCLTWAPWGGFFACGYENGQICIWDDKKGDEPFLKQYHTEGRHVVRNPVTKLLWTDSSQGDKSKVSKSTANCFNGSLYISGGHEETANDGILQWSGTMFEHKSEVLDYSVVDVIPWYDAPQIRGENGEAPTHLIALAESSHPVVTLVPVGRQGKKVSNLPCAQQQQSQITTIDCFHDELTVSLVLKACILERKHHLSPVSGGRPPDPTSSRVARGVLLIGHSSGSLAIIEERNRATYHPLLTVYANDTDNADTSAVTAVHLFAEFNGNYGHLLVGHKSGQVCYYKLNNSGTGPELVSTLEDDHRAPVTSLLYAYSAGAIVSGDRDGCLSVTDASSLRNLMIKELSPRIRKQSVGITSLHMTPPFPGARAEDLVLLFVGTTDEQLFLLNIKSLQVLKSLQLGSSKGPFSPVVAIHAVDWLGRALLPILTSEESDDDDEFHIVDEANDPSCCLLVVSTQKCLYLLLLPACTMVRVINWNASIIRAFLTTCEDEAVYSVLDDDDCIRTLTLMDMREVSSIPLSTYGVGATPDLFRVAAASQDGTFYIPSSVSEINVVSNIASAASNLYPAREITLFDPELEFPTKKPIKQLFGKSRRDSNDLLAAIFTGEFLTSINARSTDEPSRTMSMRIRGQTVSTHEDDLTELLEGGAGPSRIRSRAVNPHLRQATESMNRAISEAGKAREGLEERGEKLNSLAERVTEMAIAAEQFSQNASDLKKAVKR